MNRITWASRVLALSLLLLLAGCGIQAQWLADHHCIATGAVRHESMLTWVPIGADGTQAPVPDDVVLFEYLCDDRDEPHWLALNPPRNTWTWPAG